MILQIVLGVVAVIMLLVVVVVIVASLQADQFRIQRSGTMQVPPEKVFPLLNDFHEWQRWSPWEKIDPNMERTYFGARSGVGAAYEWKSDKKNVGSGRMEILESTAPSGLKIKLDFMVPFEAHNMAEFELVPQGSATQVNWIMSGPRPFMLKIMCLFMSMDKMVGKDFEKGLANLKAEVERG